MISGANLMKEYRALGSVFLCAVLGMATGCTTVGGLEKTSCNDQNYTNSFWGFYSSGERKFNEKCPIMNLASEGVQSKDPVLQIASQNYLEKQDPALAKSADKAREEVIKVYHQGWDDALERQKIKCHISKKVTKEGKLVITFDKCTPAAPQP